jgi:putative PIG3 family NAD(P)H quinone oxidoreductase
MSSLKPMMAIEITKEGGPEVLQATERPMPIPDANEVLIKVSAAGVNRPDVMQRKGLYPPPDGASDIPGLEVSGTIVALGKAVKHVHCGQDVCALVSGGGYAEYCLAAAELCLPVPDGLSMTQAAAIPETFFTVWSNVFDRAQLTSGEILLVHGGTSGIGTVAIQLAKYFSSKVIVTAGTDEKCQFCTQLGADVAINYRTQDFVEKIRTMTEGKGVDVILDMIGGDYFPRNIDCLAEEGRLVQIAIQKGAKTDLNLLPVMLKRLTITGSTLRARTVDFKVAIAKQLYKQVWPMLNNGRVKPIIYKNYPLIEANKAHELMESSQHIGKIVLTV